MEKYTQDNRMIRVETPLGKDVLLLQGFEGRESVSDVFDYELTMHSTKHNIALDALIGNSATMVITLPGKKERFINGIISEFRHVGTFILEDGEQSSILSHYQARLVPWFWTLKLNKDCRIFQNKNVPDIVREIFKENRLAEFEMRLTESYAQREYCVQYRESDFDFVSRLLEEEGIFYFFEHSKQKHKMILADDPTRFKLLPHQSKVDFAMVFDTEENEVSISDWQVNRRMCSEKVELRDFNFRNPFLDLTSNLKSKKSRGKELEIYDYPGEYESRDLGDKISRIRFEESKTEELTVSATTNGRGFSSGGRFELKRHPRKSFNREYAVLRAEHRANQGGNYRSGGAAPFQYQCSFTCVPHPTSFRPARQTPVPKVQGTQTAIVVGPKSEEIFVDKHSRVKVQFHWDRLGKRDENSSCWIRVSQPWAGTGFGGVTIPRIGQEVIVDFLEGDPDRPIITGRVYNGASMPPYELPANKAHSGLMSRSTPKGGSDNFNGIRFNDEASEEKMEVQAEKDQQILVKNDKAEDVLNDETVNIGNNRTEQVFGNEVRTITKDLMRTVLQNQVEIVALNRSKNIGLNDSKIVGVSQSIDVGVDRSISVGNDEQKQVGGNNHTTIDGNKTTLIAENDQKRIGGKKVTKAKGHILYDSKSGILLKVGASTVKITPSSIELNVGSSSIKMDSAEIIIAGNVSNVFGSKVRLIGMSEVEINGGIVKIN
jgi:type VI secretion system secreted protein VgrG